MEEGDLVLGQILVEHVQRDARFDDVFGEFVIDQTAGFVVIDAHLRGFGFQPLSARRTKPVKRAARPLGSSPPVASRPVRTGA
jgi:hypothetical protein